MVLSIIDKSFLDSKRVINKEVSMKKLEKEKSKKVDRLDKLKDLFWSLKFKLIYYSYYLPRSLYVAFKVKRYIPKFKIGDQVIYDLNYATVLYVVKEIKKHEAGLFYVLKGLEILKSDGANIYMTEAREYHPFCKYFDEKGKSI
jgi:hypothetical protein